MVRLDPRGVGRSTPPISLFASDLEPLLFDLGPNALDIEATSKATLTEPWAKMRVLGCLARHGNAAVLGHITTDNVTRDVLRIVEAHG